MNMEEQENMEALNSPESGGNGEEMQEEGAGGEFFKTKLLSGLYKEWFLDYASYVILERAVPSLHDGLKPVQRRFLHAMKQMDDGRYNKVANIIGQTMQYHPHGDASIGEALVQMGQKDLLIDTQGNWGSIYTGDNAAAPRYIEARLSKFALDVLFNPKTTIWKKSYDGRNNEPVTLPVKFPLLLSHGVEGIAVGLASKILPHNFNELIDASIDILMGKEFRIFPDFPTGGLADFSRYNDGLRGGQVKIRAKMEVRDKKYLVITEIPFGKTTGGLIDSIIKANDNGKIRIKKIDDNTAEHVEIVLHLIPGISNDQTIDALYAFTDCEISISPNACVIDNDKPRFMGVSDILTTSVQNTLHLLKKELEIQKQEMEDQWHFATLERIFIEKKIYNRIEDCETWESVIETIDKGLKPYKSKLKKEVTRDDIVRLTEIKIKRISKFDALKANQQILGIEEEIRQIVHNLKHITEYAIEYYRNIKKKYGKGKERRTEIRNFETIVASKVAVANQKLYINRKEGFIGTSLKKDEFICDCSDIDDIIIFRRDGKYLITKVSEKNFVGKDILYANVFKKNDERTIYNVVYRDGESGNSIVKRFAVTGLTRDKEYDVTKGLPNSKILYFTANPNGEAEIVKVVLKPMPRLKKLDFKYDFSTLEIKGRGAIGNILTRHPVHKISLMEQGESTLGGIKIWFDESVLRLNTEEKGKYIGAFNDNDRILVVTKSGHFRLTSFEVSNHYEDDWLFIEKFVPKKIFSVLFFDADQNFYYLKRFIFEPTENKTSFIGENPNSKLISISDELTPKLKYKLSGKDIQKKTEIVEVDKFIGVKSYKARGKKLTTLNVTGFQWILPETPKNPAPKKDTKSENKPPANDKTPVNAKEDKKPAKPQYLQMTLNI